MGKRLTVIPTIVPASNRSGVPTPLYVTQQDKSVKLRFKTQADADLAWRILSALAEAHADRTHAESDFKDFDLSKIKRITDD